MRSLKEMLLQILWILHENKNQPLLYWNLVNPKVMKNVNITVFFSVKLCEEICLDKRLMKPNTEKKREDNFGIQDR